MKAMPDDMIAIWVARYCVVTASQLMLIGKRRGGEEELAMMYGKPFFFSCGVGELFFLFFHFSASTIPTPKAHWKIAHKNNWISFSHARCTPPNKGNDYQKIYSDWCHEFEKYKSAMKTWEKKQAVSTRKIHFSSISSSLL
jgi:hypothetical protein